MIEADIGSRKNSEPEATRILETATDRPGPQVFGHFRLGFFKLCRELYRELTSDHGGRLQTELAPYLRWRCPEAPP